MPNKRGKRVNPRRIPMAKSAFDPAAVMNEESYGNRYYGWVLVLHAMLEQGIKTADEIKRIWDAANGAVLHLTLKSWEIHDAEQLMGLKEPYPHLDPRRVRSEAEAAVYRRKARENATFLALCSIALGLEASGMVDHAEQRRIFSNAALTLAEIENGCCSYKQLAGEIMRHGLVIEQTEEDIYLQATDKSVPSSV